MTKFVELLISGTSLGFIYVLIALGFVVIFKATEVVNFAHGSLLLLGGYLIARLHSSLGFPLAALIGIAAAALAGLVVERLLIRPLRGGNVNALAIVTIGVDIILVTDLTRRIGSAVLDLGDPWGNRLVHLGSFRIPEARLAAIITAMVLIGLFFVAFKYSNWGVAMRAAAEDGETAALMGVQLGRVSAVAWVVAGGLAAVAGVFLAAFPTPGLDNTTGLVALKAFPAAILGGIDSTSGALAGGIIVGLAETLTSGYENNLLFLGRGFGSVMPYVIMIVILLVRPSGLFGTREAVRV